ncbi:MAG: TonB-dependent receptor [Cyclobacteriaceae bacterium]|nr:TonB-dependent receptor [Cyclobacteriaceae bacterium]
MRVWLLLLIPAFGYAQKHTINGFVKDAETGESLISATIFNIKSKAGTTTNNHGFYSLTQAEDSVQLIYSYVGYQPSVSKFKLTRDTVINVFMQAALLEELVVEATRTDPVHEITQMSSVSIPIEQIKALPALMGEVDVLKILQLMPGVQSGNEGSSGLYVRGGGPDQNLILLDGVPVYNVSHLFGFFSVFNADALNHVEMIKGGFPARYGGRLSSVIDINMKDGNMKEVKGEGSVGIIAAKVTVEGPIQKDKTSFLVSARRTYIDILARPLIKAASEGGTAGYYFYDINLKLNHIVNSKNRIYGSLYMGDDKAYSRYKDYYVNNNERTDYEEEFGLKWGNVITALRWNSVLTPKLFANLTTTYSRYRFDVFGEYKETVTTPASTQADRYKDQYISSIEDFAAKLDFDWSPLPEYQARFGINAIHHTFSPGVFSFRSSEARDSVIGNPNVSANEFAAYLENNLNFGQRLKVNAGVHASAFRVEQTTYSSLQPRMAVSYHLNNNFTLKASYASMVQFIHLLTNAGLGLPTDLWVPSTATIKPQQANQVAAGIAKTYHNFEFTLEGYYKTMNNLIEYKDGASYINIEQDWQDKVVTNGRGEAYGIEMLAQKKKGKISGWLCYTLAWNNRQFDELNNGKWFPYKYDRRHDISLALTHTWNKRMDFSMTWVFGTGNAITLPTMMYRSENPFIPYYSGDIRYYESRNNYRMKNYHRLDLSFSFWKDKKWGQRKWTLGVYNAYSRLNPFFVDLSYDRNGNRKFIQYSLFPIIPSFTYSFKF